MRERLIRNGVKALRVSLGKPRPKVPPLTLKGLHATKDYEGMVGHVAKSMGVNCQITLGKVNSGGPKDAGAWILMPEVMPLYGTRQFIEMRVILHIRKDYLSTAPCEMLTATIAHEFAHVVLNAINHPLRKEEPVVDLTAMHLGYREFFVRGVWHLDLGPLQEFLGAHTGEVAGRGYLTLEEIRYANALMTWLEAE